MTKRVRSFRVTDYEYAYLKECLLELRKSPANEKEAIILTDPSLGTYSASNGFKNDSTALELDKAKAEIILLRNQIALLKHHE